MQEIYFCKSRLESLYYYYLLSENYKSLPTEGYFADKTDVSIVDLKRFSTNVKTNKSL